MHKSEQWVMILNKKILIQSSSTTWCSPGLVQLTVLKSQGCAPREIDRSPVLRTCEIKGAHISRSSKSQRKGTRGHPALLNGAIRVEAVHVMNLSGIELKGGRNFIYMFILITIEFCLLGMKINFSHAQNIRFRQLKKWFKECITLAPPPSLSFIYFT